MKHFLFLLVFVFALPAAGQDASTRLQEAVSLVRSVGDYEGAIRIYREIAADSEADRRVVAQAILQLGKAYESLGRTEAFAAYERVARDFSDQEDLVTEARVRMRGLAVADQPSSLEIHTLPALENGRPTSMYGVSVSADGSTLVRPDGQGGFLVENLRTGESKPARVSGCDYGYTPRIAPSGDIFAFSCAESIHLHDLAKDKTSLLWTAADGLEVPPMRGWDIEIAGWKTDGSAVLIDLEGSNSLGWRSVLSQMILVPLGGAKPVVIDPKTSTETRSYTESPACFLHDDGTIIAEYKVDGNRQVHAMSGGERLVVAGDESAQMLLYGCDHERDIVFVAESRLQTNILVAYRVEADGTTHRDRVIRTLDPGAIPLVSQGAHVVYSGGLGERTAVVEVPLNPETGSVLGLPEIVEDGRGRLSFYLPDHRSLVWTPQGESPRVQDGLESLDAGGRKATQVRQSMDAGLLVWGQEDSWIIDPWTGEVLNLFEGLQPNAMTPDGELMYWVAETCVLETHTVTRAERTVWCADGEVWSLNLDPTTGKLAIVDSRGEEKVPYVVDPRDGSAAEVVRGWNGLDVRWAGGFLYVSHRGGEGILRYDPQTGESELLPVYAELRDILSPGIGFAISDDQSRLALSVRLRPPARDVELFVLRNVMSGTEN